MVKCSTLIHVKFVLSLSWRTRAQSARSSSTQLAIWKSWDCCSSCCIWGIERKDVRTVCHFYMPKTVEGFLPGVSLVVLDVMANLLRLSSIMASMIPIPCAANVGKDGLNATKSEFWSHENDEYDALPDDDISESEDEEENAAAEAS